VSKERVPCVWTSGEFSLSEGSLLSSREKGVLSLFEVILSDIQRGEVNN